MTTKKSHTDAETTESSTAANPLPWIAAALFVLGLAVVGGLYWNRTSKIEEVRYKGFHYVTKQQLQQQVKIPTGVHPDSLNLVNIIKKMEEIPYVKYTRINVDPGGTMMVNITERTPIAVLANGQKRVYVDSEGIRLPHVLGKTPDVPILYGFKTTPLNDTLQSKAFKQASTFLQELHQRKASDATISEVAWNDKEGVIALTNQNGVKVIFGKGEFDDRLRNWEAFCREVVRQKGINAMKSIDLRFKGQIVTREY